MTQPLTAAPNLLGIGRFSSSSDALPIPAAEYQQRVGRFGAAGVLFFGVFFVFGEVLQVLIAPSVLGGLRAEGPSMALQLGILGLHGALVWRCQRRPVAQALLQVLDASVTILLGVFWATLLAVTPETEGVDVGMVFSVTATLYARALLIPSTAWRSVLVGAATIGPVLVMLLRRRGQFMVDQGPMNLGMYLAFTTLWCVGVVITTAFTSQLLFGLRRIATAAAQLGQYSLERKLGEGSSGVVYLAHHATLRRPAAVKILRADRLDAAALARFEREVQLTGQLHHPNTGTVFDYGWTSDGVFYYAMEYLEGLDLEALVQRHGPQPAWRVVHLLRQAAGALAEAHGKGLLHRDVKPGNLILSERGGVPDRLFVVDFGLAESVSAALGAPLVGTPGYIPPEALLGASPLDSRADLYALGAVGYFLLTGGPVFSGATAADVCAKHVIRTPDPPSAHSPHEIPPGLDDLLLCCLARNPAHRPGSARELARRLDALARQFPPDEAAQEAFWAPLRPRSSPDHPPTASSMR
jgi:serine/threonine-protein kinase